MPEESLTPEERLLRLIRGKGKVASQVPKTPSLSEEMKKASFPETTPRPSKKNWRHLFLKGKEILSFLPRPEKAPSSQGIPLIFMDSSESSLFLRIQRILFALVAVALFFSLTSRFIPQRQLTTTALLERAISPKESFPKEQMTQKPYEYYGSVIEKRDLFQAGLPTRGGPVANTSASTAEARFKDLTLVGIISGKNPQAIIEDKKDQKTYFLKTGESLGELRIEQILDEKVTLSYEGEQFDLML